MFGMKILAVRTRFGDKGGQNNEALNSTFPVSAPSIESKISLVHTPVSIGGKQ
jgi:hypothetical protein